MISKRFLKLKWLLIWILGYVIKFSIGQEKLDNSVLITFPISLLYKEYSNHFMFNCTVADVVDQVSLMIKSAKFCGEVIRMAPQPWTQFFIEPEHCQNMVKKYAVQKYKELLSKSSAELKEPSLTIIKSNDWCGNNSSWLWQLDQHEIAITSQGGQDGILQQIFSKNGISATNYFYVEIGFNSMTFEGGSGSNTYNLFKQGWRGLLLDIANENKTINLYKHYITPENIISIFDKYRIPYEPDYISIDIDSKDLWVLRAILSSNKYQPRVVSIEYNPNLPLGWTIVQDPTANIHYNSDIMFGSAAGAIQEVANEFGYSIVHVVGKYDVILIRTNQLQPDHCPKPLFLFYHKRSHAHYCVHNPQRMFKWIDYVTWRETGGDVEAARFAAIRQVLLGSGEKSPSKEIQELELKCLGIDMSALRFERGAGAHILNVDRSSGDSDGDYGDASRSHSVNTEL